MKWYKAGNDLDRNMNEIELMLAKHVMLSTKYLRKMKINLEAEWNEQDQLLYLVS